MGKYLDPRADLTFKKVFADHKDLMISFLNAMLPLPDDGQVTSIEYLPFELIPTMPMKKDTIVDVRCEDQRRRQFIVEMQMIWTADFFKRVLFNSSKAYVKQLKSGEGYSDLQPVYSLNLINEAFLHDTDEWYHDYGLMEFKYPGHVIEDMHVIFIELPKFKPHSFTEKKMTALWLRFLTEIDGDTKIAPKELLENPETRKALDIVEESAYSDAQMAGYDHVPEMVVVCHLRATDNAAGDYLRYMGLQIRPVYGPFYEGAKVKGVSVTNVSMNDAYVKVTFEGGYADASEIGLCYATTSSVDPDQNNKVTAEAADIAEDGTYTFHVSNLDPNTTYYFAGYIVCQRQRSLGATSYLKTKAKFPIAEMVDLGLSVKWAKWNIGASSEDEYGSYIAWGDPTGEDQSFDNSHYPNAYSDISGTKYDVATTQWGDKWRIPTPDEWKELDGLTKELVTLNNGNIVFKVTAKNGNYIYLPRGGFQTRKGKQDVNTGADYWTSKNT